MTQKGLAPILIILLIAVAVGGYLVYKTYLYCPAGSFRFTWGDKCHGTGALIPAPSSKNESTSSGETANWKTYINNENAYQIQYPSNLQLDLNSAPNLISLTKLPLTEQYNSHTGYGISVFVGSAEGKTLEDIASDNDKYKSRDSRYSLMKTELNGIPAYKVTAIGFDLPTDGIQLIKNNKQYQIVIKYFDENKYKNNDKPYFNEAQTLFNQILSTFKFLDQNQTSNTSLGGSFSVTEQTVGDTQIITIKDKQGNIVVDDLVSKNSKEIGYNVKFKCQCGTSFKKWISDRIFSIKVVNGGGEEYEYLVDASNGKVDESSFKKIK